MTSSICSAPVAMLRGSIRLGWWLYDANGKRLTDFYGELDGFDAMQMAAKWCEQNGYYLSEHSDADDRKGAR